MTPEEFLAGHPDSVRELAQAARGLVKTTLPDVAERVYYKMLMYSNTGESGPQEQFMYIDLYKEHINLGFIHGINLPDPAGFLQGTGKTLRHIKIKSLADLDNPAIGDLILAAQADDQP